MDEAARILRTMRDAGETANRKTAAIHLFGIKYANELWELPVPQIVLPAGLPPSCSTEVSKGRALSDYVAAMNDFP